MTTRTWFATDLETVATFWRVLRSDGVTLGFTTHDADLWFDGVLHAASPGMIPSSIRKTADLQADSAEVQGALTHDTISATDLASGRFDGAHVVIGIVDWQTLERDVLYRGTIGSVIEEDGSFSAELASLKTLLDRDPVPRTSPTCRAAFCGPGCNLSPPRFTQETRVVGVDLERNAVQLAGIADGAAYLDGVIRFHDGPQTGIAMRVIAIENSNGLVLDTPLDVGNAAGMAVRIREGCDHTLATCSSRFGNAVNFRGEPFLPGNDMLVRYPGPSS